MILPSRTSCTVVSECDVAADGARADVIIRGGPANFQAEDPADADQFTGGVPGFT
jgi:hypothetical protein